MTDLIVDRASQIPGFMSINELTWLSQKAASLDPGARWVEVGVFCGRSFLAVALSLPQEATLIGVDRWLGTQIRAGHRFFDTYLEAVNERPDLQIILKKMSSVESSSEVPEQSCDVVFIDGDHSEEGIRDDVTVWRSKIMPGGTLCGHDYLPDEFPGVIKVVDELQSSRIAADSIWEYTIA